MPATELAGQVTNGYRSRVIALRDAVASSVARNLDQVDLDVDRTGMARQLSGWLATAAMLTDAGSEQAAVLTGAYLEQYLRAAGVEPEPPPPPQTRPSRDRLTQASTALLWQLGRGAGRQQAVATALAYAARESRSAVMGSARDTLRLGLVSHPRIVGWRRVTSARTCQRCADQAGVVHRAHLALHTHLSCRCTQEPVLSGLREVVQRQAPTVVAP